MALADGEAFASLAEADAYALARSWSDWAAAGDAVREGKLREGADYIVATTSWPGRVVDDLQVLPFPRTCARDADGRLMEGVPARLKAANIEAARLALTGPLMGGTTGAAKATMKSFKAGSVAIEYADSTSIADIRRSQLAQVRALIRSVGGITAGGAMLRLSKS